MAMTKVTGTEFSAGMKTVDAHIAQSGSRKSDSQIRVYRNESGEVASVYKVDAGSKSCTFEGLLRANAELPKKGEQVAFDGDTYYVESAELIYQNDEVQKIRVTGKKFADLA